jgi:hypothetical protein
MTRDDYGEKRADGQYENYPTPPEGELVQPVRESYVHAECEAATRMSRELAEGFARDPDYYDGTYCATCEGHFSLDEFRWKNTEISLDEAGVVADHEDPPRGENDAPEDYRGPVHYVHAAENHTVTETEFIERYGETELGLLTPDPLKYKASEGVVSLSFEEVRLRVTETDKTGVAYLGVYDCSYSNPMKQDYDLTEGSEIILTLDGGAFEVVGDVEAGE